MGFVPYTLDLFDPISGLAFDFVEGEVLGPVLRPPDTEVSGGGGAEGGNGGPPPQTPTQALEATVVIPWTPTQARGATAVTRSTPALPLPPKSPNPPPSFSSPPAHSSSPATTGTATAMLPAKSANYPGK